LQARIPPSFHLFARGSTIENLQNRQNGWGTKNSVDVPPALFAAIEVFYRKLKDNGGDAAFYTIDGMKLPFYSLCPLCSSW
jgi:hypothetical protein